MGPSLPDRANRLLTDEAGVEGRACEAIPDEACVEAPRNFLRNAGNGAAPKLAEQLASPGLVLRLLLAHRGGAGRRARGDAAEASAASHTCARSGKELRTVGDSPVRRGGRGRLAVRCS